MDSFLEKLDHKIVVAINSLHTPFWDEIMWFFSSKSVWIPLYVLLVFLAYKKLNRQQFIWFVMLAIGSVVLADLISTLCFKEVFMRYRPSHHLELVKKLHFYEIKPGEYYQGGQYGFISSHAANFFAIAVFVGLTLKTYYPKLLYILLLLAVIVSFSRIYLGVHYLSDVLMGGLVGSFVAYLVYRFVYKRLIN